MVHHPFSSSLNCGFSSHVSDANISVVTCKPTDNNVSSAPKRKEYPVNQSIPDIKSNIYGTDEFRMFSFKIMPCSRAYFHDWTECPFVHPSENDRRRDPRKFHYNGFQSPQSATSDVSTIDKASAMNLLPGSSSTLSAMLMSPFSPTMLLSLIHQLLVLVSKIALSCHFKPTRLVPIVTCGKDFLVNFYEGPPFKFKLFRKEHSNLVNCFRFSPDGSKLISVSSDKMGIIYDGKIGETIGELSCEDGHTGADSKHVLTVSIDECKDMGDI
ncbi:hypothetical protein CRYUN_Cryun01aG0260000 [Craigia yunnanensis]